MCRGLWNLLLQFGFIISIIMNGFLLGLVLSGPFQGGHPPMRPEDRMIEAAQMLSPESREKVMALLQEDKGGHPGDRMSEDFEVLRKALLSKELTSEKLDEVVTAMQENHDKMSRRLGEKIKDLVLAIPDDEERIRFFETALPERPMFPPPPYGRGMPGERPFPPPAE